VGFQRGLLSVLQAAGTTLPGILNTVVTVSIHTVIFLFGVVALYMEGPRVLEAGKRLSPMDDTYEDRLFHVFGEFANNMVIGSLATAGIQGVIATIGYVIVGVEQAIFLGLLTSIMGFVPIVGTLVVWLPVSIYVGLNVGWGWGLFLALYSLVFTGTIDNLLRPLFMRGQTDIHPFLVFLAVFGGMSWMGISGVLVGPVLVAFFLALYTIFKQDFLGEPPEPAPPVTSPWMDRLARLQRWAVGRLDMWQETRKPPAAERAGGSIEPPESGPSDLT